MYKRQDALETRDPAGVALRGLGSYQRFHAFLRQLRGLLVAPGLDGAAISSRLTYDWAHRRIRVQWYSRWRAKSGAVLGERPLHVDGVSFFDLNDDGKVYRHTIERVLINGVDAAPPFFGLIDARRWLALNGRLAGSPEPAIAAPVGAPNWSERR